MFTRSGYLRKALLLPANLRRAAVSPPSYTSHINTSNLPRAMATSSKVQLSPQLKTEFNVPGIGSESARAASDLLQENHEKHHIFFNQSGFHNHIVHHLLTLFALGASPAELKKGYDENASYQRPPVPFKASIVEDMHIPARFKTYLGKEKHYHDFLSFFQKEIDQKGWGAVINEYAFKGDERADDMLVRLYAGFLHPIIHLGFGVEFEQPAIIAEALAQAAVHDSWVGTLFFESEKAAKESGERGPSKSIVQLIEEMRSDKKLVSSAHFEDGNKIRDGILKRAPQEMINYASQYRISSPDLLEEKTAEMINASIYFTSAAQHPPHQIKFDFFYMHCVNSSIFFSTFLRQPWLSTSNKIRLLEWKVRLDLAMYISRGSPKLLLSEITNYTPKKDSSWGEVIERVNALSDDGHASKLVRALKHGEEVSRKFEGKDGFVIEGNMWRQLGNMAIDSVEAGEPNWVRSCGFEEAWEGIPERETAARL